jgi:hypothetical protein
MPHIRPSVDDGSQRELTSNVVTDGRHIFSVPSWAPRSAVPSLHVVPDIRHLSAPCVMVALAGIVHDRETLRLQVADMGHFDPGQSYWVGVL